MLKLNKIGIFASCLLINLLIINCDGCNDDADKNNQAEIKKLETEMKNLVDKFSKDNGLSEQQKKELEKNLQREKNNSLEEIRETIESVNELKQIEDFDPSVKLYSLNILFSELIGGFKFSTLDKAKIGLNDLMSMVDNIIQQKEVEAKKGKK